MRAWPLFRRRIGVLVMLCGAPAAAMAQVPGGSTTPVTRVSMDDAVRLTLEHNQTLRAQRLNIDESKADIDVARASRLADWRVEFGYGYRREYSDMVTLQVGMDLPLFAGNRQNRDVASAAAMGDAAAAQWDDGKRRLEARVVASNRNLERLDRRLTAYNDTIVPQTEV